MTSAIRRLQTALGTDHHEIVVCGYCPRKGTTCYIHDVDEAFVELLAHMVKDHWTELVHVHEWAQEHDPTQ